MSPSVSSMATVKQGSDTLSTTLTGVGEEYITVKSLELSQGRFIQYIDTARMQDVCVIGSYVNEESFNGAGLGEKLYINGNEYTVVGVLAEQADNTSYAATTPSTSPTPTPPGSTATRSSASTCSPLPARTPTPGPRR